VDTLLLQTRLLPSFRALASDEPVQPVSRRSICRTDPIYYAHTRMDHRNRHIARSAVWNHAGKLVDYIAWYCSSVLIARGLGVDQNGVLAGAMSAVHLVLAVSSLGLEVATNKFLPQLNGDETLPRARGIVRRIARARFALYLIVSMIFLIVLIVTIGDRLGNLRACLPILMIYGLGRAFAPLAAAVLVAHFRTDRTALVGGSTRLLELIVFFVLYRSGLSLQTTLLVVTGTVALQVVGYVAAARKYWTGTSIPVPMRPIWTFGVLFWANSLVDYFLGRQGDILFLTLLGGGPKPAALYDVSYSVLQAGSMALTVGLSGVTLSAFAQLALGNRTSMDQFYGSLVRITSFLVVPALGFLFVVAPDLIHFLYSDKYAGAAVVLQVMLMLRIIARLFAGGENADYLLALDRVGELVVIGLSAAGITILLHVLLIPRYGAVGAAWAGGIGALCANIFAVSRVRRHGTARIEWRLWGLVCGMTLVSGCAVFFLSVGSGDFVRILIKGALFVVIVFPLALFLRPLEARDAYAVSAISRSLHAVVARLSHTERAQDD